MSEKSFVNQKAKLLADYDKTITRIRAGFIPLFGDNLSSRMVKETREEYELLIPLLPWVGGRQPFTQFIVATGWFLSMYRASQRHGIVLEQVGQLVFDTSKVYIESLPGLVQKLIGNINFNDLYLNRLRKRAQESHQRKFPGDYVFNYVEGDGITFDYGVDYLECASCKFLEAQGAMELAPYLCSIDQIYSDKFGWGLARTMTLAEGYEKCDFRFKKGAPTRINLPKSINPLSTDPRQK